MIKKKELKPLKEGLLEAVNKVLKENKADFTNKIEKIVKKSIKKIIKRNNKQIKKVLKKQATIIDTKK